MVNQFFYTIQRNLRGWLVYAGGLFIIQVALAAVFKQAGAGLPGGMGMLINLLPDAVRGFVGSSELDLLTANGALAVAYNHPLTKLALGAFAVGLSAHAVAGELEWGTLDLVLARPIRRFKLLLSNGLAFLAAALVLGGIMLLGTWVGAQIGGISGEVSWGHFFWLAINSIALVLAMAGIGYLFSTLALRGGQATAWAGGLIVAMFFLDWFATMWDKVQPLNPLSIFYYYKPERIIIGTPNWWVNSLVLLVVAVTAFCTAMFIFERRDLTR
jgi:ABC-2 type transport system permease protein